MYCLIGAGDSTKSTILTAISNVLSPNYTIDIYDSDFFNGDVHNQIQIDITLEELPESLMAEDTFGLYLRGNICEQDDEPKDGIPVRMTIRFMVDDSLEPTWNVVCNRLEQKMISCKERRLIRIGFIGDSYSKDMTWARGSILNQYSESTKTIRRGFTIAQRATAEAADFSGIDSVAEDIKSVAIEYGVPIGNVITNRFLLRSSFAGADVGLYEADVPFALKGLGSQRLLSIGLNTRKKESGTILLIDEIENGLEPYRLRSLINVLRHYCHDSGQVFFTTHSPISIVELTTEEIFVVQSKSGKTKVGPVQTGTVKTNEELQGKIRSNPEAFLAKRIIICEGKTEYGFLKSIDNKLERDKGMRLAGYGTGFFEGHGSEQYSLAELFHDNGYEVAIWCDSDCKDSEEKTKKLQGKGIAVFRWDDGCSIEKQIMLDCAASFLTEMIQLGQRCICQRREDASDHTVISALWDELKLGGDCKDKIEITETMESTTPDLRHRIYKTYSRKGQEWFKRVDFGQALGTLVLQNTIAFNSNCTTLRVINQLMEWAGGNTHA